MTDHRVFYRRNLPHWQLAGATLFVTFRLAGSLPQSVIAALREKRELEERALSRIGDLKEREKQADLHSRLAFGWWDTALEASSEGPRWLAEPQVATVAVEALHYRDEQVYDLVAFCVMPNHVHLVCTPLKREDGTYHALQGILHSLKRFTARRANQILERQGAFWQAESYDHVVRDADELARVVRYVINNPVKAGLVSDWEAWPWTYVRFELDG